MAERPMWPCHSVYRETAKVERTIPLLDLLAAPATITNTGESTTTESTNLSQLYRLVKRVEETQCTFSLQESGGMRGGHSQVAGHLRHRRHRQLEAFRLRIAGRL